MKHDETNPLRYLNATEQDWVRRYIAVVRDQLGSNLVAVYLYGSAARGDMWSARFPIHSDIDVLLLTCEPIASEVWEELVNATYPLYLECGRQIGPQWRTLTQWNTPTDVRTSEFKANVELDGHLLWHTASE